MSEFKCKICNELISYSESDQPLFNHLRGACLNCYTIISTNNYPININDATTIFSPMGNSLGDKVLGYQIAEWYQQNNSFEEVVFLKEMPSTEDLFRYKPNKIFWANFYTGSIPRPKGSFWFSVCNEASQLAKQGFYSRLWFDLVSCEIPERYVVFHLRNIVGDPNKPETKNINPTFVYSILKFLQNKDYEVVLIGNDSIKNYELETIYKIIDKELIITDYRNKLPLTQIAYICKHAYAFIGRDSGLAHIAGATGCKRIVAWNYENERWFPKVQPDRLHLFTKDESTIDNVISEFSKIL